MAQTSGMDLGGVVVGGGWLNPFIASLTFQISKFPQGSKPLDPQYYDALGAPKFKTPANKILDPPQVSVGLEFPLQWSFFPSGFCPSPQVDCIPPVGVWPLSGFCPSPSEWISRLQWICPFSRFFPITSSCGSYPPSGCYPVPPPLPQWMSPHSDFYTVLPVDFIHFFQAGRKITFDWIFKYVRIHPNFGSRCEQMFLCCFFLESR